jgi:hypothetical protein
MRQIGNLPHKMLNQGAGCRLKMVGPFEHNLLNIILSLRVFLPHLSIFLSITNEH